MVQLQDAGSKVWQVLQRDNTVTVVVVVVMVVVRMTEIGEDLTACCGSTCCTGSGLLQLQDAGSKA
jgi:hypothetical protein